MCAGQVFGKGPKNDRHTHTCVPTNYPIGGNLPDELYSVCIVVTRAQEEPRRTLLVRPSSLSPLSPPDGGGLSPCFHVRKRKNSCSKPLVYSGSTLPLRSGVYDSRGFIHTMKDTQISNTICKATIILKIRWAEFLSEFEEPRPVGQNVWGPKSPPPPAPPPHHRRMFMARRPTAVLQLLVGLHLSLQSCQVVNALVPYKHTTRRNTLPTRSTATKTPDFSTVPYAPPATRLNHRGRGTNGQHPLLLQLSGH